MTTWKVAALAVLVIVGAVATARTTDGVVGRPQAPPAEAIKFSPNVVVQIGVSDMDRAVAFYTTTLGFTLSDRRDDLQFAHIASSVPGLEIGLSQLPAPKGSGSVVLNIGVAHVGNARRALESRGVVFRGDTVVIPGKVALAAFADLDGNMLRLAGPPGTAIATK
jgi:catechol 2,3-dioxygenase-like lactoylglutathione lyase family enzyme